MKQEILVYGRYMIHSSRYLKKIAKIFDMLKIHYSITPRYLETKHLKFIAYCRANSKETETGRPNLKYVIPAELNDTEADIAYKITNILNVLKEEK